MHSIYQLILALHVASGSVGLLFFWFPVIARKGGRKHRRAGRVFASAMLAAGASAVTMTLLLYLFPLQVRDALHLGAVRQQQVLAQAYDSAGLLLALGLLLMVNVRQALLVLRHKQNRAALRTAGHRLLILCLAVASLNLGYRAITDGGVLPWVFSILGGVNAVIVWRYVHANASYPGDWLRAHIGNILGAGIGAHTAFLVTGGRSVLELWVSADLHLWLWILPSVIGVAAILFSTRYYVSQVAARAAGMALPVEREGACIGRGRSRVP